MWKPHPRRDLQQLLGRRRCRRLPLDAERLSGTPNQRRIADRVGRCQEHQSLRGLWQAGKTPPVAVLDVTRKICRVVKREAPCQLGHAHAPRQLQQRERIATGFRNDPVADGRVESARDDSSEQGARICLGEPSEGQVGQT